MALHEIYQLASNPRHVLVGSLARAAVLGDNIAELHQNHTKRFQDIDLIDRHAELRKKYTTKKGTVVDYKPTDWLRPIDDQIWGLYTPEDLEIPYLTLDESVLELNEVTLGSGTKAITPSPAVHVELTRMTYVDLPKHHAQIRRLVQMTGSRHHEITDVIATYHEKLIKEKNAPYYRFRRTVFNRLPRVALSASEGDIGKVYRKIRGTQPPTPEPLPDEDELLIHGEAETNRV